MHAALGDEDFHGPGSEPNIEGGADGPRLDAGGADNKRAGGVLCDGESSLPGQEEHAALRGGVGDDDGGAPVEFEQGAIVEEPLFVADGDGDFFRYNRGM